ncbi:hypothetical protein Pcinc_035251 [Petrolisthes cinctipes]|uniref:Uncharacterized protein n=1 Tax=Petrolisthes cinctipes TaxID=88211 RepID=A0AAE1C143_PETCI|nr:hypothetical protein Pcinc_035251 [Petrolisthes cinctipes]
MKQHLMVGYQQAEAERRKRAELGMPLLGKEEITEFRLDVEADPGSSVFWFEDSEWSSSLPRSPTDATHHHYFDRALVQVVLNEGSLEVAAG